MCKEEPSQSSTLACKQTLLALLFFPYRNCLVFALLLFLVHPSLLPPVFLSLISAVRSPTNPLLIILPVRLHLMLQKATNNPHTVPVPLL